MEKLNQIKTMLKDIPNVSGISSNNDDRVTFDYEHRKLSIKINEHKTTVYEENLSFSILDEILTAEILNSVLKLFYNIIHN